MTRTQAAAAVALGAVLVVAGLAFVLWPLALIAVGAFAIAAGLLLQVKE